MNKTIIIQNKEKYIELPFGREKSFDDALCVARNAAHTTRFSDEGAFIDDAKLGDKAVGFGSFIAQVFTDNSRTYAVDDSSALRIGSKDTDDIRIPGASAEMTIEGSKATVHSGYVYRNGSCCSIGEYPAYSGDTFYLQGFKLHIGKGSAICSGENYKTTLLEKVRRSDMDEDFPNYKRSPRIIKREPTDRIEVKDPPAKPEKKRGAWMTILMPIAMVCITVALGIFMKRGIMILMSASMMTASAAFSAVRIISERKDTKEKEKNRVIDYKEYLLNTRKRLNGLFNKQKESLTYHNPSIKEIEEMVASRSGRIYEHASNDADFLCLSLGRSVVKPSYNIAYNSDFSKSSADELQKDMQTVVKAFTTLPDMPTVVDLKNSHLAFVGEKENIHIQIKALVTQLAFFQSYHDVNIVLLTYEESRPEFEWMRWLPHCRLKAINTLSIISTENQRDKILGNITSQLKERKMNKEEQKKSSMYLPHYIFIVDNPKLIISHSIMEYLQSDSTDLGFSVVFTTHLKTNVPENIKTVLLLDGRERGTLLLKEGQFVNQPVSLSVNEDVDYEGIARGLCPIIHNKGVTTQIPDMLTFFDMYGIKGPDDLSIAQIWSQSACNKSLAVPLGARAEGDYVFLNLHEKAHGPHGLVAGTTGSGKSEAIQSYILSLALNFHPYDVGFLLIDYKGGGMAKLFENLPHLLGIITNLDGSESMRALASIKSELARRQRVFNDNDVNNINDYTKLFKAGKAEEPLPHLFIISDEFAELKKEQPEFMKELVSTARIGRSLGVHLILATQKPSGVVDDQIWSNSRFKLALKVQNEADSNEILKTPDAASITQSGRAYLQIGNNEIYELFQTAWSGAPYRENEEKQEFDERVYLENDAGQGELLNADLGSGSSEGNSMTTQLDILVESIADVYDKMNVEPVTKPWLPPLSEQIVSTHIKPNVDVATFTDYNLTAPIGVVDIPENQEQTEFEHDFFGDGNLAFFGASGYGKSVSMMTVSMELAVKNSPELLQFYILDFGNSSLIQLKGLPHTADYITYDDSEKIQKFIALITEEIAVRKRLFAKENAVSFKMYNQTAATRLPAIIVEIDNYDVVKEMGTEMEEFIVKLTRDGNGVGIYTMLSASRANAVRYSTLNNFKTKIALYSFDPSDIMAAVGRSSYTLTEVRGRALVKLKEPHVMQSYLPVEYENDIEYAAKIKDVVQTIADMNTARAAKPIPVLPDTVYFEMLEKAPDDKHAAIGLDADTVHTVFMNMSEPVQLIVGAPQTGKTNLLSLLIGQLSDAQLFIADSKSMELHKVADGDNAVILDDESVFLEKMRETVIARKKQYEESGMTLTPREFYATVPPAVLIIDDVDNFVDAIKPVAADMEPLVASLSEVGICTVATTVPSKLRGFDNITKIIKDTQSGVVLGNPTDQMLLSAVAERGYRGKIDMGFMVDHGNSTKIMIPRA